MEISRNQHVEIKAHHDVIIIGAGLAGLTVAIEVAKYRDVLVLIKNELTLNASAWAQGGIVGVLDKKDSFELHVADTLEAGAGIVLEAAARYLTQNSASAIAWLLDQGVLFTRDSLGPLGLHLTREGGHTHKNADVCLVIPTINPSAITPHSEAFQAIVWHLMVSHPKLKTNATKW